MSVVVEGVDVSARSINAKGNSVSPTRNNEHRTSTVASGWGHTKCVPKACVYGILEQAVRNGAVPVLGEIAHRPLLSFLDGACFLAGDEEVRIFACRKVEDKLTTGVLGCCDGTHNFHLFNLEGR